MTQKKYETIVGVFVVLTLLILLAMVLVIAQHERLWEARVTYQAIFKNVSGLKEGAEVRLSGVTVGSVKKISFDPQGNIVVQFEVLAEYRERIRADSKATIGYIGLLGDMCLDISTGSMTAQAIPPGGVIPSVEPLDLATIMERAGPSIEDIQEILANLSKITTNLADEQGDLNRLFAQLGDISAKINAGQGSLGKLVNDPELYNDLSQAISGADKVIASLNTQEGLIATLLHDRQFKSKAQKSMDDLKATLENFRRASADFRTMADRLPELIKKGESFVEHLNRAGAELPELVTSGQGLVTEAEQVAKAAQKSWFLRSYVPKKKEKTIRLEREISGVCGP